MIPLVVAFIALLFLFVAIDDPLRDFTSNHAEISEEAKDPALRPLVVDLPPESVVEAIGRATKRVRSFRLVGEVGDAGGTSVMLERTSRIWKFVDDVTLRVEERDGRTVVTGESRSRVGKADLGQNPRNLRRILAELRIVLEDD